MPKKIHVLITLTNCKNLAKFKETVNSILNTWTDVDHIDAWFCADDNSSIEDREQLNVYDWIEYAMQHETQPGLLHSMNLIWNKVNTEKPTYWIHIQEGFVFHVARSYVLDAIRGLEIMGVQQIIYNRNYGETIKCNSVQGHKQITNEFCSHEHKSGYYTYQNCHYWPHFSFRPGMTKVDTILPLGNFDSPNNFFELDYANRWKNAGNKTGFFNQITCQKTSNAILFYVGPAFFDWNYTFGKTNALGGSEQAVRYLSRHFPEYIVYVCGDVIEEKLDNVHYVREMPQIHYKTIIVSRNLSFFEKHPHHSADRVLLMAHDTILYGVPDVQATLAQWKHVIKTCVCLTKYHVDLYSSLYPSLPLSQINNGIEPDLFIKSPKIPNRFIFTSRSERGLEKLLDLWPFILEKYPDATLMISSYEPFPKPKDEHLVPKIIGSVKHLGKLSSAELYAEMAVAEYWVFPSEFTETSCITAMEMMASRVKCFYYQIGGLVDTMGGHGIPMTQGHELDALDMPYDVEGAYEYALSCSWKNKASEWKKLIEPTILNLVLYTDIPHEIEMKKVQESYIHNYPFVYTYYVSFRDQEHNVMVEKDTIYVKGVEDEFTIIHKVIEALKLPFVYDYVYRTNISTVTDFKALLPQLCMYGGDSRNIYSIKWPHGKDDKGTKFGFTFVQGTCIVLNKRAVDLLLKYDISKLTDYEDDVIISHVLQESGITPTYLEPYIYRTKTLDRMDDVTTMKQHVSKLV